MKKIINSLLFYSKIIFVLIAFTLMLYIVFSINDYYKRTVVNIVFLCIPMFLVLLMFILSIFNDKVKDNILFNAVSTLAYLAIIIIGYRTIFDQNMVLWIDGKMNFYYFENSLNNIIILNYLILAGNILLFVYSRKHK